LTATYCKNDSTIARQIAGETILVPIRGDLAGLQRLFAVDAVGEHIWQQLDAEQTVEQLCESVQAHFDVGPDQAQVDVKEFVAELVQAGLVEERP
jgi:hypothetical protein